MAASSGTNYENLIIDGVVSARPVKLSSIPEYSAIILLLGPTGSGKSSFIKALSAGKPLDISADSLQGVTRDVVGYKLRGVKAKIWKGLDVYIVDTPGFADSEISEMEVVQKVQHWTTDLNDRILAFYVLYCTSIVHPRLPGSQRQLFSMLKAMRSQESQHSTTLLTTCWDQVATSAQSRAAHTFQQLQSENFISNNSRAMKFDNTYASAMAVLSEVLVRTADGFSGLRAKSREAEALQILTDATLVDRIRNLETELSVIEEELSSVDEQEEELKEILLSQQVVITNRLMMFKLEQSGEDHGPDNFLSSSAPSSLLTANSKSPALQSSSSVLQNIHVTISLRTVRRENVAPYSNLFVLMGPTGSGKSSFIQALSLGVPLNIVGGGLESVTQDITVYELLGVKSRWANTPIYLLDTPGFADPRMSESRILKQLQTWAETINTGLILRVIYTHAITDNRMPGTKEKCLDIFQAFCGEGTGYRLALVTTMWDKLFKPEQFEKANKTLDYLRKNHWKGWISRGSQVMIFRNNLESVIQIIDTMLAGAGNATGLQPLSRENEYGRVAFDKLAQRIQEYEWQLQRLDGDIVETTSLRNSALRATLIQERKSTQRTLDKFVQQYNDFVKSELHTLHTSDVGSTQLAKQRYGNDRSRGEGPGKLADMLSRLPWFGKKDSI